MVYARIYKQGLQVLRRYLMTSEIFINLKTASADIISIITFATDKGRSFLFGSSKLWLWKNPFTLIPKLVLARLHVFGDANLQHQKSLWCQKVRITLFNCITYKNWESFIPIALCVRRFFCVYFRDFFNFSTNKRFHPNYMFFPRDACTNSMSVWWCVYYVLF